MKIIRDVILYSVVPMFDHTKCLIQKSNKENITRVILQPKTQQFLILFHIIWKNSDILLCGHFYHSYNTVYPNKNCRHNDVMGTLITEQITVMDDPRFQNCDITWV